PKAADNSQLLSDFLKRRPTIVISVRLCEKSSNTGRSSPNECRLAQCLSRVAPAFCAPAGVFLLHCIGMFYPFVTSRRVIGQGIEVQMLEHAAEKLSVAADKTIQRFHRSPDASPRHRSGQT